MPGDVVYMPEHDPLDLGTTSCTRWPSASAGCDEQPRLLPLPVVAERKGKVGELARPGSVCRLQVGLVAVAQRADGPVIAPVKANPPGRLREEAIRNPRIV